MNRLANQDGLNLIKVEKEELLKKLIDNRTKHVAEYESAVDGFKTSRIEELQRHLDRAIAGEPVRNNISFDEPACHTDDYDTVIEMLQMSVDEEIYITMSEFKQYVQDKWNWSNSFSVTNSKYLSS